MNGYKGYVLYKIQTSHSAWVRVYINAASRSADVGRELGADPAYDAGVIAEVVTSGEQTVIMAPAIFGFNDETPITTTIPVSVKNQSGSSANITVSLTILQAEQ